MARPATRTGVMGWGMAALLLLARPALSEVPLPPKAGIADTAGMLTEDQLRGLLSWKSSLERQRNLNLLVLTLPDAEEEAPEALAARAMATWQAGPRSVLVLVLQKPQRIHIQPSEDLAAALDAEKARDIAQTVVAPTVFRPGSAAGALNAGLESVAKAASAREGLRGLGLRGWGSLAFSAFVALMWVVLLKRVFTAGVRRFQQFRHRKACDTCGGAMGWRNEVVILPTRNAAGRGLRLYLCQACGTGRSVAYAIPMQGGFFLPQRPGQPAH
jgi:uncharacterized membrane protein YgcG